MVLQVPIDFLMLLLAGFFAYALRFTDWAIGMKPVLFDITALEFMQISFWVAFSWLAIFALLGLYTPNPNRRFVPDAVRVIIACSAGLAAVAVYILFTNQQFDSRFLVAASWGFAIIFVILGRLLMRGVKSLMYRNGIGLRRVAVIGADPVAEHIVAALKNRKELGYHVVKTLDRFTDAARKTLQKAKIDELLFTNPRATEKEALAAIEFCNEHHKVFKYSADLFSAFASNSSVHPVAGIPVIELKRTKLDGWGRVLKRIFDIVLSAIILIVGSPLYLLLAILILLETGRPVIYKNERVGLRGRKFTTLKFRSMYQKDSTGPQFGSSGKKAEKKEAELIKKQSTRKGPIYKVENDPRVTPLGKLLRRASLDELPQFWNVLRGDMSIVGPRPHQIREVEQYEETYRQVFTLKPGITGLAQISGRSDLPFEEEMRLDIFYIENWSLLLDMIIFLKTPFILFKSRKAE